MPYLLIKMNEKSRDSVIDSVRKFIGEGIIYISINENLEELKNTFAEDFVED